MQLTLNCYYRFGYTHKRNGQTSYAYTRYVRNQQGIDELYKHLKKLEACYPYYIFWIESSNDDISWVKLLSSKYALFSED